MGIRWKTQSQRGGPVRPHTVYVGSTDARRWPGLRRELTEFWIKLCSAIGEHQRGHPGGEWKCVVCDLTLPSGRVSAWPARKPSEPTGRVTVQLNVPFLAEAVGRFPDLDEEEDEWLRQYGLLYRRLARAVVWAAEAPAARRAIEGLRESHPFTAYCMEQSDDTDVVRIPV